LPTCGRKEPLAIADIPLWIPERGKNSKYTVQVGTIKSSKLFTHTNKYD